MEFKKITPILYSDKLLETIRFYTEILSFNIEAHDELNNWVFLKNGDVEIMLSHAPSSVQFQQAQFTGSLYIEVIEIDKLWENLKNQVNICYELEEFPWHLREFAIYDNNGYIIQFAERI